MKRFVAVLLSAAGILSGWSAEKTEVATHLIPVREHGALKLTTPKPWHFHFRDVGRTNAPPTAGVHSENSDVSIQITVFWDGFGPRGAKATEEEMTTIIRKVCEVQYVPQSVEKQVVIEKFKGPDVSGLFARFTDSRWVDKEPPRGEHRNVTTGMFRAGNLWGNFTLLTADKDGEGFKRGMAVLESLTKS